MSLENKIAIVTGGSRDIGRAVSETLAAEGAKVVVNYFNNAAEGDATVTTIQQAGGEAIAVKGDMTKQADVDNLVAESCKAFGDTIDILVNVVGGLVARKPLAEMDEEFFEYVMKLNVTSTFLTTRGHDVYAGPREGTRAIQHPRELRLPRHDQHDLPRHVHEGRGSCQCRSGDTAAARRAGERGG